jgi:hypothetical protein
MLGTATVDFTADIQGDELYIDRCRQCQGRTQFPTSNGMRQCAGVRLKGASGETSGRKEFTSVWRRRRQRDTFPGCDAGVSDNTLQPGEIRTESFVVPMPETTDNLMITAQLFYRLTPEGAEIGTNYLQLPYRVDFATEFLQ